MKGTSPGDYMAEFSQAPSKLQIIKASSLLNGLTQDEALELATSSHMAFAERGSVIWLNGSSVDFFGIVGIGFVKMVRMNGSQPDLTTELMGPGQVFGLLGAIDGKGCPQSAQAVCNCWYLKVGKRQFLDVYRENVVLKDHLVQRTTQRLRSSLDMVNRMSKGKVDQRIASILLLLAESYGVQHGEAIVLEVPLTRQDISEMAGTTVETTIRVMSGWQKKKIISTHQQHVCIQNLALLETFC